MAADKYPHSGSPESPHCATSDQYSSGNAPTTAAASAALGYTALLHNNQQQQKHHQQQQHHQQHRRLSNAPSESTEGREHVGPIHAAGPANQDDTSEDEIESLKRAMGSDLWALQRQRMRREQMSRPRPGGDSSEAPNSPATQTDASPIVMGKTAAPPMPVASSTAAVVSTLPNVSQAQHLHQHYSFHQGSKPVYPLPQEMSPPVPQMPEFSRQEQAHIEANASSQSNYMSPPYMHHTQQHSVPMQPVHHNTYVPNVAAGTAISATTAADSREQRHAAHAYVAQAYSAIDNSPALAAHSSSAYVYVTAAPVHQPNYTHYHHHQQQQQQQQQQTQPQIQPQPQPQYQQQHFHHQGHQQWSTSGYPSVPAAQSESNTGRYESASAWSNDQMSTSYTDNNSNFSQPHRVPNQNPFATAAPYDQRSGSNASTTDHYLRLTQEQNSSYSNQLRFQQQQQQQSSTQPHANPPGYIATGSPPMEQKIHAKNMQPGYSSSSPGVGMAERSRNPRQEMAQGAQGTTMPHIDANKDGIVVSTNSPANAVISSAFTAAVAAVPFSDAHGGHVIDAGSTSTYHSDPGYRVYPQYAQNAGVETSNADTSVVNAHLLVREMQEQRQSPSDAVALSSDRDIVAGYPPPQSDHLDPKPSAGDTLAAAAAAAAPSTFTIRSLLNSPLEEHANNNAAEVASSVGTGARTGGRNSIDGASDSAAIHEHIAKENARFRQNSTASSHLPALLQHAQQISASTAGPLDSSPNSQSSYHSAGYSSMWQGRAETVNQDFATAQQSLSSAEGAGLGVSFMPGDYSGDAANSGVAVSGSASAATANAASGSGTATYFFSAPLPTIPASVAESVSASGAATSVEPHATLEDTNVDYVASNSINSTEEHKELDTFKSVSFNDKEFSFSYYEGNKSGLKPVSIIVQVGDDSQKGSDDSRELGDSSSDNLSQSGANVEASIVPEKQSDHSSVEGAEQGSMLLSEASEDVGSLASTSENLFASSQQPGRKATMESLDNVLEYYRTHPGTDGLSVDAVVGADTKPLFESFVHSSTSPVSAPVVIESDAAIPQRNPFDSTQSAHYHSQLGSSRAPVRDAQISPAYPCTSFSSPMADSRVSGKTVSAPVFQPPHTDNTVASSIALASSTAENSADDDDNRHDASLDSQCGAGSSSGHAGFGVQKVTAAEEHQPLSANKRIESSFSVPPNSVAVPADSSILGTHPHSREATPIDADTAETGQSAAQVEKDMHTNDYMLSTRRWHVDIEEDSPAMDASSRDWSQSHVPPPYRDMHSNMEDIPEPDDLVLPPTSVSLNLPRHGPRGPRDMDKNQQQQRRQQQKKPYELGKSVLEDIVNSDDECIVQMESIDGMSELSDILDISTTHDSEYGYTNSNSSTDSFGEPIEHEAGILSKSLLAPSQHDLEQGSTMHVGAGEDMVDLASGFARVSLTPMTIHQLNPQAFSPSIPSSAMQTFPQQDQQPLQPTKIYEAGDVIEFNNNEIRRAEPPRVDVLNSGRTNASTLTTSTAAGEHSISVAAAATAAIAAANGRGGTAAKTHPASTLLAYANMPAVTGTTVGGSKQSAQQTENLVPLEIMEYASELEISLAREQEDYFSDNVSPANLDPVILQNLGKAVHQQCLLQRQHQLLRRKSNMHLGLGAAGGGVGSSDEQGHSAEATVIEPEYDDYEQALKAMLVEVSQYFAQSGLNFVFPFSAKWVDWLTRHPDRPFPWRKDPEDEDEVGAGRGRRGRGREGGIGGTTGGMGEVDDEGEYSESQSDASSFSEEMLVLSRPLPPEDVLAKATIPMSTRRPVLVKDFVSQEKRKGINAHWQYYSVINQIVAVASGIHHKLLVPEAAADHSFVAHQLAALYQFLGGDFKKYKPHIESVFDMVRLSLNDAEPETPATSVAGKEGDADGSEKDCEEDVAASSKPAQRRVLDGGCVNVLRDMMASIIADALYSTSKMVLAKEHAAPGSPTGTGRTKQQEQQGQEQQQQSQQQLQQGAREVAYAISTLKGLPTQPIVRYLNKEMRVVCSNDHHQRRRRGLAHNLSRNSSMGHIRHHHHQFLHQHLHQQQPVPPLPHQMTAPQQHGGGNNGEGAGGESSTSSASNNNNNIDVGAAAHGHEIAWYEQQQTKARRGSVRQTPAAKQAGIAATNINNGTGTTLAAMLQPILSGDEVPEQQQQQ
ncbi:hypothetical protein BX070DRAFT_138554 [Coemansia spiralis]|nr:hypothetical protein BX070DRAFT_138554 [Coemansia spiralis]